MTGLHFTPGDAGDLADKVRWAAANAAEMQRFGKAARKRYEERYTPDASFTALMAIYRETINPLT